MSKYSIGKLPLDEFMSVQYKSDAFDKPVVIVDPSDKDDECLLEHAEMEDGLEAGGDPEDIAELDEMIHSIMPPIYTAAHCLYLMLESNYITTLEIKERLGIRFSDVVGPAIGLGDKDTWPTFFVHALLIKHYGVPEHDFALKSIAERLGVNKAHDFYDDMIDLEDYFHDIALLGTIYDQDSMPVKRLHEILEYAQKNELFDPKMNYAQWLSEMNSKAPKNDEGPGYGRYLDI